MKDIEKLKAIASSFDTAGAVAEVKALGEGFINDTLTVVAVSSDGKKTRYILQRKNHNIFPDVPGMMHNIDLVTAHLKKKIEAEGGDPLKEVLTLVRRRSDSLTDEERKQPYCDLYFKDEDGG